MKRAARLVALMLCAAPLLLSSCATELKPPSIVEFDLAGRIAARHGSEAFTGNLAWRHATSGDDMLISTPLGQDVFNPPTVFSYFPAGYGLPGTSLVAPEFGILDTSTSYQRANFVNTLFLANSGNGSFRAASARSS